MTLIIDTLEDLPETSLAICNYTGLKVTTAYTIIYPGVGGGGWRGREGGGDKIVKCKIKRGVRISF